MIILLNNNNHALNNWSPWPSVLQVPLSLKSPWVCSDQTVSSRTASYLFPGRGAKCYAGMSQ